MKPSMSHVLVSSEFLHFVSRFSDIHCTYFFSKMSSRISVVRHSEIL